MALAKPETGALNAICPYFTMFPLAFPMSVLRRRSSARDWVVDPFCGRGTTNLAARLLGLPTFGIDSHPLAIAISSAKLVATTADEIMRELDAILGSGDTPAHVPHGRFWELAFHPAVLSDLCVVREALLGACSTAPRVALRAVVLGALHGPQTRGGMSHLSNQAPRTYAPKPDYAVRFWQDRLMVAPEVDVREVVRRRALRYFPDTTCPATGSVVLGDARTLEAFETAPTSVAWFVTSPPYYGLRTYVPDQWLRLWFLGGPEHVQYADAAQLAHHSPESFASDLRQVWVNCARISAPDGRLVIRFGGINDRKADPLEILRLSLAKSGWRMQTRVSAGTANRGRRQAASFTRAKAPPREEFDLWVVRE
ncbi:MAG: DNA methyltransferase [Candidatus Latescibacterota bacterium]